MSKKISKSTLMNIVLGCMLVAVAVFGYLYYMKLNPLDVAKTFKPNSVPEYAFKFAFYGDKQKKSMDNPCEVVTSGDNIWVSDTNNSRVLQFDRNGKQIRELVLDKKMVSPVGMFWDGTKLWVADYSSNEIFQFDKGGAFVGEIKLPKGLMVSDIAVDNGYMYILNNAAMQVVKYDLSSKKIVKTFGGYGKEDGQLYYPYDLAVRDSKVYVADSLNNRINIYTIDGKFLTAWAKRTNGQKGGGLFVPRGISFDNQGRLFTVEGVGHRVTALNQNGEVVLNITQTETIGEEVQSMNLPTDVAVDNTGRLYVLEHAFRRVLVYNIK